MVKFLFCGDFVSQDPNSIQVDNSVKSVFSEQDFVAVILGAGLLGEAYKLSIVEKAGLKIGLLSLVHKEFGALGLDSKSSDFGVAWSNHPKVNQLILDSKQHCDLLFVLPHAGIEDVVVPLPEWRARYKEFIDLGADAVIATQPHTPQACETKKPKQKNKSFQILHCLLTKHLKQKNTTNTYVNSWLMIKNIGILSMGL